MIEAFKFSFAKRTNLGDHLFVNNSETVDEMLSPLYAVGIKLNITDDATHETTYYEPIYNVVTDHGTSHIAVISPDGGAVSMTSTLNYYFGSKVRGHRTGIIFNNQMADFSIPDRENPTNRLSANVNNYPEPGKRPMSSTCPSIILNKQGQVVFVTGGSGGSRIPTGTAQVLVKHLWLRQTLEEATSEPRLHHQLLPPELLYEPGFPEYILKELTTKGHLIHMQDILSVVHSMSSSGDGTCNATVDGRRFSAPDGF